MKLSKVKVMMVPREMTPKLMLMLKELRCEGAGFIHLGSISIKTFFSPSKASHISWCGTSFFVNILHDISICFISLIYEYYLIFVRRLKHGSARLGKSFLPTQRHHLLSQQIWLRRENEVLKLHRRLVCGVLH
jgi:hypothetical protein